MVIESKTKELIDALQEEGYEPYSYSGRNMYGARCVAVNTDDPDETNHKFWDKFGRGSIDQMGKGYVVYWTSYPLFSDPNEDSK